MGNKKDDTGEYSSIDIIETVKQIDELTRQQCDLWDSLGERLDVEFYKLMTGKCPDCGDDECLCWEDDEVLQWKKGRGC